VGLVVEGQRTGLRARGDAKEREREKKRMRRRKETTYHSRQERG
jgi:hypothetical protein